MFEKEINFAKKLLKKASKIALENSDKQIIQKASYDYVTDKDKKVEKFLLEKIKSKFPNDKFISEEFNPKTLPEGRTWIIDPIDGTINFMYNLPMWCIQLCFLENSECKFAIIYIPCLKEMYVCDGKKVLLNNKQLKIDKNIELKNAIININDMVRSNKQVFDLQLTLREKLGENALKVKNFGSAGYEFCCVASGRIHGYILFNDNIWDYMPGSFICKTAGLEVYQDTYSNKKVTIIATNKQILDYILNFFK